MANRRNTKDSNLLPDNPLFQPPASDEEGAISTSGREVSSDTDTTETTETNEVVVVVASPLTAPVGIRAEVSPANVARLEGFQTKHGISRSEALDLLLEMIDEISPTKIYDLKEAALLRQLAELKAKYQG